MITRRLLPVVLVAAAALAATAPAYASHGGGNGGGGTTAPPTTPPAPPPPAAAVSQVLVLPASVASGDPVNVVVQITQPAPTGGAVVGLSSSNSAALPVPATVTIPAGQTSAPVTPTAGTVATETTATLTEAYLGQSSTQAVDIAPKRVVTDVNFTAPSFDGAVGGIGSADISPVASSRGFVVTLTSSNPAVASVPATATATVAPDDGGASFNVTTTRVQSPVTVTITASGGGVTRSAPLTITPTPVPPFDVTSISVAKSTGTITTTTGAPAGGQVVRLTSSDPKLVTVPATVTVPAGATTATFPVTVAGKGQEAVGVSAIYENQGPSTLVDVGSTLGQGGNGSRLHTESLENADPLQLGFYGGGKVHVESGQLPPGVSLVADIRPGEFVFNNPPKAAGTYTFVIQADNGGGSVGIPYVWVITP